MIGKLGWDQLATLEWCRVSRCGCDDGNKKGQGRKIRGFGRWMDRDERHCRLEMNWLGGGACMRRHGEMGVRGRCDEIGILVRSGEP